MRDCCRLGFNLLCIVRLYKVVGMMRNLVLWICCVMIMVFELVMRGFVAFFAWFVVFAL